MNFSFWEIDFLNKQSDIIILGAGISGISTAISLREKHPELTVSVLERSGFSLGASTKNAGFACFGSPSEVLEDIRNMGEVLTIDLIKMRWKGLELLCQRIQAKLMDYKNDAGFEVFGHSDDEAYNRCIEAIPYLNNLIGDALALDNIYSVSSEINMPGFLQNGICNKYEGSLHPVKMMRCLYQKAVEAGVNFFFGLNIESIDKVRKRLVIQGGEIPYKMLCICTNGFASQLCPELEVTPARNQVLITKPVNNFNLKGCYHFDHGYYYFRSYENRILLGGGRNLSPDIETTDEFGQTELIQSRLIDFLDRINPGLSSQVDYRWSGILGVGPKRFPICKWIESDILVGVRLGGMGVAIGSYLGETLAEMISEKVGATNSE